MFKLNTNKIYRTFPSSKKFDENIDDDIHSEEMNFIEELNDIINLDDTTVYMADLPLNKYSYPPSCAIYEGFINKILQDSDYNHNSVIIKTKIRRNCTKCAIACIKFSTHEEVLIIIDEQYIKLDNVPTHFIAMDEVYKVDILNSNENCIIIKNLDRSLEVMQIHDAISNCGKIISCQTSDDSALSKFKNC